VAATNRGFWGERISDSLEITVGDICQYDFYNLRIQNSWRKVWEEGLADQQWPDMWTPLKDFADPKVIKAIKEKADKVRVATLSATKRVSHVN